LEECFLIFVDNWFRKERLLGLWWMVFVVRGSGVLLGRVEVMGRTVRVASCCLAFLEFDGEGRLDNSGRGIWVDGCVVGD
jgi:hypothetical protein